MTEAASGPAPRDGTLRRARPRVGPEVWLPLVMITGALGYPLFLLITSAFNVGDPQALPAVEYGVDNFVELGDHLDWIGNTLLIATGGTIIGMVMATGLAWIIHRTTTPGSNWLELLVAIPYPLGPLVGALAWSQLGAPRDGLINQAWVWLTGASTPLLDIYTPGGIMFVEAVFEAPVAVLIIGAAMQRMDPSLEESSAIFGGGKWRTALKITLPLMMPAILSAALFMFTSMIGAFAIPTILGTSARFYVATNAIYVLFQGYPPNYPLAAALGIVLIVITGIAVWLVQRVLRGRSYVVVTGRSYRPRRIDVRGWKWLLLALAGIYVCLALVLPLGALLLASLQTSSDVTLSPAVWTLANYKYVIIDFPTTRQAIINSLILGVGTGTLGVAAAVLIALAVHRSKSAGRGLLEQATMLPQAFPRLIFAFGFLWMILTLPVPLYGTLLAVLLAYLVVFLPLAYRGMSGVVVQIDAALEEAARIGGAGWWRTLRTVTAPLLKSGILATWALLFMVSVREISASLFLSDANTPVLGPAIFSFWDSGGLPRVSALAMVQAIIILVALYAVRRWAGRDVRV